MEAKTVIPGKLIAITGPVTIRVSPPTTAQVVRRLRAYREAMRWSKSKFAVRAGLKADRTRQMDEPDWNPTANTLRALDAIVPPDFEIPRVLESFEEGDDEDV